jgi:hypothetical protein
MTEFRKAIIKVLDGIDNVAEIVANNPNENEYFIEIYGNSIEDNYAKAVLRYIVDNFEDIYY